MIEKSLYHGAKNNDLTQMNSALLLDILRKRGVCSRVELAKETGLTQAGITKLVSSLIEQQILKETGILSQNERGRKSIGLQLNDELGKVVSINFSRTFIKIAIFDINGRVYNNITVQLGHFKTLDDAMLHVLDLVKEYVVAFPDIKAIGIALPGPYLRQSRQITVADSSFNWFAFRPQEILEENLNLPVYPIHDADAAVLSYRWRNDVDSYKTLTYMLLGEGVGAGIVIDGKLFEGSFGTAAEIGHMSIDVKGIPCSCGNRGCLERYCSTSAIVEKAKRVLNRHPDSGLNQYKELTYYDIFNEFDKMDPLATSIINEACEYIGYGVVNLINAYNPDLIVLGNIMCRSGVVLLNKVNEVVHERIIPEIADKVEIRMEPQESDSILYGCAMNSVDYIISNALSSNS